MVYIITDGINFLAKENADNPKLTKNKEDALRYQTEKRAVYALGVLQMHMPEKVRLKWSVEALEGKWVNVPTCRIWSEKGFLTYDGGITTDPGKAGLWTEEKAMNVLKNNCSTDPLLRKNDWQILPDDGSGEYLMPGDSGEPSEIFGTIDPDDYVGNMEQLAPFLEGMEIRDSAGLVQALSRFYENVSDRQNQLIEERAKAERQLRVIEHAIELNEYGQEMEHTLIRLIHNVTRRRRIVKDELQVLKAFLKNIPPALVKKVEDETEALNGRYYKPKEFSPLFKDSDNAIILGTLEE